MRDTRSRRLPLALGVTAVVVLAAAAGSTAALARTRNRIDEWVIERAAIVESAVADAVAGVVADLESIAAYVEASAPDAMQFIEFVDAIGATEAAAGVAYVEIIPVDQIDEHVDAVRASGWGFYEVSTMDSAGSLHPLDVTDRDFVYPVLRFALGDAIRPFVSDVPIETIGIGLDGGYNPDWRDDVTAAVAANAPSVSEFIDIEFDDVPVISRVFFVSVPVHDGDGEIKGLVAAPMIEPMLLAAIGRRTLDGVEWEVVPVGGEPIRVDELVASVFPLEMPGATWSFVVAPTDEARAELEGTPWWVLGLISGLLSALIATTLVLLVERRVQRRRSDALRRIADDKDRFLATVSHELRTPLTAVSGLAHELRDRSGDFDPAEQVALLEMVAEQSDELAAIVEDLLIAARSDIGKVVMHFDSIDVELEARRAMESAGMAIPMSGTAVPAWADAQRVRQILRNMLSNARRYGGPDVRVEFSASAKCVAVAVVDNGPPIPEAQRVRIFDSYTSAHRPSRSVESVGLGLYISRNLARAMRGELEYEHDGAWSRFELTLPSVALAAAVEAAPDFFPATSLR